MTNEKTPVPVALALGSNIGDRLTTLKNALTAIQVCVNVEKVSPVYETTPAYVKDQPVFLNAVVLGTTKIEPLALLWSLKDIENELGRTPTFRYGPRAIDIDMLFYGDTILEIPELIVPHPRLQERDFVLTPLNDIAPNLKHPKLGKTVSELLALVTRNPIKNLGNLLP